MINQFLMQMTEETSDSLYALFGDLRWPVYAGMLLLFSSKFFSSKKQKILILVIFLLAHEWGNMIPPNLYRVTDGIFPRVNMGVAFLFFLMIAASAAYMLKLPVLTSLDAVAPVFLLGRGVGIIGCIFAGCCHGFPCSWGLYSFKKEILIFPAVILDALFSYVIVAYLILRARKTKYCGDGSAFAVGAILFGLVRILIDILRDNEKLFLMLTVEGFFGVAYVLIGMFCLRYIQSSAMGMDKTPLADIKLL